MALGWGRGGQGAQGLKCKLGTGRGSGEQAWDPALCGAARGGSSHHGQSHHAERQHAGPEQGSLGEAATQPPDDQALEDLDEGERVEVGAAGPAEGAGLRPAAGPPPPPAAPGAAATSHSRRQAQGTGVSLWYPRRPQSPRGDGASSLGTSHTRARAHACTCMHAHTHARARTYTHAHAHVHAPARTHTCIASHSEVRVPHSKLISAVSGVINIF